MRITTATDLGGFVRLWRQKLGWTQAELADRVGVSRQWIGEFEGGKSRAELGLVLKTVREVGLRLEIFTPSNRGIRDAPPPELAAVLDLMQEE